MKVMVCGGRDFADREALFLAMDRANARRAISMVIVGGASGADALASEWAEARGIHCAVVKAMWKFYGKAAGPMRNRAMLLLYPEAVIAFPGGNGTADMCNAAEDDEIVVWRPLQGS